MARKLQTRSRARASQRALAAATALYIRVSTEHQAEEGYSLDAQRDRLLAYCAAQEWPVEPEHIYVDAGVSGKSTDRPAFQAMLTAAQEGRVGRVVALKLDRIARNVRDFLGLVDGFKALGCELVLLKEGFDTGTPHGKFALTMFAAMAELEAATITERVLSGKRQKASTGGYNGSRTPYGYTYDGERFTIEPEAAQVVRAIFEGYTHGESLKGAAARLNGAGVPTARGGQWYASTVRYVVSNGAYAGLIQWDGVEAEGSIYPPIVEREVYEQAIRRLED